MEGGRGVVLALQNEFTEIFYIIFGRFLLRGNEFYPNIPSNVELCQIQVLIGLKETTKQNTNEITSGSLLHQAINWEAFVLR